MRTISIAVAAVAASVALAAPARAQLVPGVEEGITLIRVLRPEEAGWREAPDALPEGARIAVARGEPSSGASVVYLWAPPGYEIPAHWNGDMVDLHVVDGTAMLTSPGGRLLALPPGAFASIPATTVTSLRCVSREPCIVSMTHFGPWEIHYVTPPSYVAPDEAGPSDYAAPLP